MIDIFEYVRLSCIGNRMASRRKYDFGTTEFLCLECLNAGKKRLNSN